MDTKTYRIGTRTSVLALKQTDIALDVLKRAYPDNWRVQNAEIVGIKTTGDKITDRPLADIGGKALFVKEIHQNLLDHSIDFGVHSLKDMEAILPSTIQLGGVLDSQDRHDVFITKNNDIGTSLKNIKFNAKVGTCSPRRTAQLLYQRPDLNVVPIRGNVLTRLQKLAETDLDAIVLAIVGLKRLNMLRDLKIDHYPDFQVTILPFDQMLPAVGQGIIALDCRNSDEDTYQLLKGISHLNTEICIKAERALLRTLSGNCHTPIAALAELISPHDLKLKICYAPLVSEPCIFEELIGSSLAPEQLGMEMAHRIKRNYENLFK